MIKVGIDCDGILFNFSAEYARVIRKLHGDHYPEITDEREQVLSWDWVKWHPATQGEILGAWNYILRKEEDFFEKEEVLYPEDVAKMVEFFNRNQKLQPYFITSRDQTLGKPVVTQTINALNKLGWVNPQVIVSFRKGSLARALDLKYFIDDRAQNCAEVALYNPSTKVYLMDKAYNRFLDTEEFKITRVSSVIEFIEIIAKDQHLS